MGTVMNGKKWAGACVNGKVVSGLVKNGVVFYRMPVSTYRRRIMVGDNLSNRTIFQDFPDGFYKSGMSDGEQFNLIESNNINIYEYYIGGSYNVYCGNRTNSNLLYRYDLVFGRTMTKKDVTTGTYLNATVTEVNENKTYRHLFIEDENIRPLEVGDVITENTKFYFTFPDDFYNYIKSTVDTSGRGDEVIIVELDNDNELDHLSLWYDALIDSSKAYCVRMSGNYYSTMEDAYRYIERTSPLLINKSIMTGTEIENFVGTVTMVHKTNEAYQHILVDTTTLGA